MPYFPNIVRVTAKFCRDFPDDVLETANEIGDVPNGIGDVPNDVRKVPKNPKKKPMPKDYVPTTDTDLQAWVTNFVAVLNGNFAAVGLVAADVTPLTAAQTAFNTAITTQVTAEAAFRTAVAAKRVRRMTLEQTLRPLVRRIANHPGMTDALRANLNITIPNRVPSRRSVGPEIPGMVLERKPGQVAIHFGTNPGNELTNGKPLWASGCNIYRKMGAEADYRLIAFDTASPYVDVVSGPAINVSYKVVYRGVRATDLGGGSPEQTVAAGS